MPHGVKKVKPDKEGKSWVIYNKDTGKIKGRSSSKSAAQKSARARDAGAHGWKPSKSRKGK